MTSGILQEDLPQTYTVKYLGHDEAHGLWGIKHTRKPVDNLVQRAKKPGTILPIVKLLISEDGCQIEYKNNKITYIPIDTISYGVQDLVYTRVFSIIIVKDCTDIRYNNNIPFECHAFVCDNRQIARSLTYTLANAFQEYSKTVRITKNVTNMSRSNNIQQYNNKYFQNKFSVNLISTDEQSISFYVKDSEA